MLKVGFVGWRGMVGAVLIERMILENDFAKITPIFFSTSDVGGQPPQIGIHVPPLKDAYDLEQLVNLDCIISAQGSEYTNKLLPQLLKLGYTGYWLDASSALRMDEDSVIILDPVNREIIDKALGDGIKKYIDGNCTVSLLLMALHGLFKNDLIQWVTSMTYQAASGGGAKNVRELLMQTATVADKMHNLLIDPTNDTLSLIKSVGNILNSNDIPIEQFQVPLIGNVIPWIDIAMNNGQTREEWKAGDEGNKILGNKSKLIPIDSICSRVGSLRCHAQALTIKLTDKNLAIETIEKLLIDSHPWLKLVANTKEDTLKYLTPVNVSNTLDIAVGRLRKLNIGPEYLTLFTVGDQLLWGAAEPLRRMLNILVDYHQ